MRYFKAVKKDDITDEFYVSCDRDFPIDAIQEHLGLWQYNLTEVGEQEFQVMTQEEHDYILNAGDSREDLTPLDSARTQEEAIEKAKKYLADGDWKCLEVVYMPIDDDDINEIVWAEYRK